MSSSPNAGSGSIRAQALILYPPRGSRLAERMTSAGRIYLLPATKHGARLAAPPPPPGPPGPPPPQPNVCERLLNYSNHAIGGVFIDIDICDIHGYSFKLYPSASRRARGACHRPRREGGVGAGGGAAATVREAQTARRRPRGACHRPRRGGVVGAGRAAPSPAPPLPAQIIKFMIFCFFYKCLVRTFSSSSQNNPEP